MDRSRMSATIDADGSFEPSLDWDHLGALAAAVRALEPDIRLLADRVRAALVGFERSFEDDSAYDDFDLVWVSTGAAALYNATVELAEVLSAAVEPLSA